MSTPSDDGDVNAQDDLMRPITDADGPRLNEYIRPLGLSSSNQALAKLEIFIAEHRVRVERRATDRLTKATDALKATTERTSTELKNATERTSARLICATWVLAAATLVLAGATIALVIVTFAVAHDTGGNPPPSPSLPSNTLPATPP
jgi:hypothetical protein